MVGLKLGEVSLEEYNQRWQQLFEEEKLLLLSIFKDSALAIEHIGSTSVFSLKAKPIIDIAMKVKNINLSESIRLQMDKHHYFEISNFFQDSRRLIFGKGINNIETHHLHLLEEGHAAWDEIIAFRDFLRNNPQKLLEYQDLKEKLGKKYSKERAKYTKAKAEFIQNSINQTKKSDNY